MMRNLIVANWKANPESLFKAQKLFSSVSKALKSFKKAEVVICPPFLYIPFCRSGLKMGSQDCFWSGGVFTGEISPLMLKDMGVSYVILGHSKRREALKETDEIVSGKLKAVLKAGLKPILCIGSNKRSRNSEFKEIKKQLKTCLSGINRTDAAKLVVVYEPVWAISTTKNAKVATASQAQEGAAFIRNNFIRLFGRKIALKIRILYGGSVDSKNVGNFLSEKDIQGALVGAASLKAKEFIELVRRS